MVDLNIKHKPDFTVQDGAIIILSDILMFRVCEIVTRDVKDENNAETHVRGFMEVQVG